MARIFWSYLTQIHTFTTFDFCLLLLRERVERNFSYSKSFDDNFQHEPNTHSALSLALYLKPYGLSDDCMQFQSLNLTGQWLNRRTNRKRFSISLQLIKTHNIPFHYRVVSRNVVSLIGRYVAILYAYLCFFHSLHCITLPSSNSLSFDVFISFYRFSLLFKAYYRVQTSDLVNIASVAEVFFFVCFWFQRSLFRIHTI